MVLGQVKLLKGTEHVYEDTVSRKSIESRKKLLVLHTFVGKVVA
jgi:hypothetical protein